MIQQNTIDIDINKELRLGVSLHQSGKLLDAELSYKKILSKEPKHFDSLHLLGVLESQKGNNDKALKLINQALQINPKNYIAYNNMALVYKNLEMFSEALDNCEKAIALKEDYADALSNKGKILIKIKQYEEAKSIFLNLNNLYALNSEYYFNLAIINIEQGDVQEAIKNLNETIKIKPNFPEAYFNLANIYLKKNQFNIAKENYNKCILMGYENDKIFNNLGHICDTQNDFQIAEKYYKKAINFNKKNTIPRHNLINLQLKTSDWSNIDNYIKLFKDQNSFHKYGLPINLHAILDDPNLQKYCNENFLSYEPKCKIYKSSNIINPKIKIGYFSADFSDNNPVSYLIKDLIKYHDRRKFEIYGFSLKGAPKKDTTIKYYEEQFDKFFNLEVLDDKEIKNLCSTLNLDLAIDLNGYTQNSRPTIFSHRLAPIQVNFLGYPGTLGSKNYHYIIADRIVIPEKLKKYYSEKIVYLPETYFVNPSDRPASKRSFTKDEFSIPQSSFVYCCFNQNYKILPNVFDVWMNILKAVDSSVLLLAHTNQMAVTNLKKEASKRKIDPNRIIFASYLKNIADHLTRYEITDLFLDTLPYNAHTTASDAIWAGVPLITCIGNSFASRVSSSILASVGLDDLITYSLREYEEKAIEIGKNSKLIYDLKNKITNNRGNLALFNCKNYTKNLEFAFEKMIENFQNDCKFSDIVI